MSVVDPDALNRLNWKATRWSLIPRLADKTNEDAWTRLFQDYYAPMLTYTKRTLSQLRGRAVSQEDAADVVQSYLRACVEKSWLARARPEAGKFRAFVQMTLKRHVLRQIRDEQAQRRSPRDRKVLRLDHDEAPLDVPTEPELNREFDRHWAAVAVERALARLGDTDGRGSLVIHDLIRTDGAGSPDIHEQLGVRREHYNVLKGRVRASFSQFVAEEMRATVSGREAMQDEWAHLRQYLP